MSLSVLRQGLFSVATSSTKSAGSIRKELLRAFDSLGIDYNETTGSFECRFVDTSDESGAGDESIGSVPQSPVTDDEDVIGKAIMAEKSGAKPNWKRIVVFECYIVKIGWVALNGIRFRRISGNIWQVYKKGG
jgi:hypothetical protein